MTQNTTCMGDLNVQASQIHVDSSGLPSDVFVLTMIAVPT